jgi:hypothetical protein
MDVELGRDSEEHSSAIDPDFALKSFHAFRSNSAAHQGNPEIALE